MLFFIQTMRLNLIETLKKQYSSKHTKNTIKYFNFLKVTFFFRKFQNLKFKTNQRVILIWWHDLCICIFGIFNIFYILIRATQPNYIRTCLSSTKMSFAHVLQKQTWLRTQSTLVCGEGSASGKDLHLRVRKWVQVPKYARVRKSCLSPPRL